MTMTAAHNSELCVSALRGCRGRGHVVDVLCVVVVVAVYWLCLLCYYYYRGEGVGVGERGPSGMVLAVEMID